MSKKQTRQPAAQTPATPADPAPAPEKIVTLHGESVPAAELEHIAPHLRPFAVAIGSLKRDPNNARSHGDEDLASTAGSLQQFGQQDLLHFDPQSRVVKIGNGRHEAAAAILGWKWIAAIPSNLPPDQLRAFALAHNRTAEKSQWDFDKLQAELDALGELQIDLTGVGFSDADLAKLDEELAGIDETSSTIPLKRKRKPGGDFDPSKPADGNGEAHHTQFKVVIDCSDADDQRAIAAEFKGRGYKFSMVSA